MRVARHWLTPGNLLASALGALLGVVLTFYGDDWLSSVDYRIWPIASARLSDVQRLNGEVRFRTHIVRHRDECRVLGAFAYAKTPEGFALRANAARVDGDMPRDLPVGIEVDTGEWRAWPIAGARTIVFYAHHACGDGRLISTKLFEVPL